MTPAEHALMVKQHLLALHLLGWVGVLILPAIYLALFIATLIDERRGRR